ncbi:transposase, partial [Alloalcanivorax gelatiniphagus]|uniref:transposase n=1 Tax=Alloalcanivorax gelatiniphagus TaxID=1194167 RepID=UPI003B848C23
PITASPPRPNPPPGATTHRPVTRLNTSVLEGMNNRIKVIKRMAYGYRDSDYFFLKIKAAFPGNPR